MYLHGCDRGDRIEWFEGSGKEERSRRFVSAIIRKPRDLGRSRSTDGL